MRPIVNFLPPWRRVEGDEEKQVFGDWIRKYLPSNEVLTGLKFSVIGIRQARDEMAVALNDGRIARVILPDRPYGPPSKEDPIEIYYFDDAAELNEFILRDAAEHQ